jgi:hypothetical protein
LQEGDVVVRINDDPTIEMTHEDAHMKLLAAGDSFTFGVLRFYKKYLWSFNVF